MTRIRLLAFAALAALVGCSGAPLNGSVSELFPLDVSAIAIERNAEAFQVTYLHNQPTAVDIVASISVSLNGVVFQPGATVQLDGDYAPDHPRCTVVHHADGEPERALPAVSKGHLTLDQGGNPGQGTSGSFTIAFVNDGGYGSGRDIYGSFSGVALDAGF